MIRTSLSIAVLVGLAACGDNLNARLAADAGPDAAAAPDAPPDAAPREPGVGLAVISTDSLFASATVSLIDPATRQVAHDDCIDASTPLPAGMLALAEDIALPSHAQPDDRLVIIARDMSRALATLTWVDPATCTPVRQLDVSTGFYANPHDVIGVSATKAYVTRFERNATASAPDGRDQGDDLLIIDPSVPAITGRIDLSSYAVAVPGAAIQARPDTAILVGGTLYVALDSFDAGFAAAGHGRLVAIDTATDQVTATIDLPDLKNCNGLSYLPVTHTLAIACGGAFSDAVQSLGSGIVFLDLDAAPPIQLYRRLAATFGGDPLAAFSGSFADGAFGIAATNGAGDQLWTLDVAAGTATKLGDASDAFSLGPIALDPTRALAFVTDASAAAVRVYNVASGATPAALPSITASTTLVPRTIAWY